MNSNKTIFYPLDTTLAFEAARTTESAAIASYKWIGRGDEKSADQAAVDSMRNSLNKLSIKGKVVIGEGERDEAPMLYIGEKVGKGIGPNIDIALDPLEGTTICATGRSNSLAVLAFAQEGGFLNAPDVYMDKIAVGPGLPKEVIDLDESPKNNLINLAKAKKLNVSELVVCILDRPRHKELISKCRETGAKIFLISDGDVAGVISASQFNGRVDIYMGIGGAPEGVLAAAALRCIGGFMQGRLVFANNKEITRAQKLNIADLNAKYELEDLANGDVIFSATGVTDGSMLKGVKLTKGKAETQSILMHSHNQMVRMISTQHGIYE